MSKKNKNKKKNVKTESTFSIKIHNCVNAITNHTKKITEIISIVLLIISIINVVFDYCYKIECENYYKIPSKYFSTSIDGNLVFSLLAVLLVLIAFFPPIKHYFERKNNTTTKFSIGYNISLSILLGSYVGVINVIYIIEIVKTETLPDFITASLVFCINGMDPWLFIVIVDLLFIANVLGILSINRIRNIKSNIFRKLIIIILSVITAINFITIFAGINAKIASSTSAKRKTKYEFIENSNRRYIVLSEYNNKKLVVKYNIKKQGDSLQCEILTNKYYFVDDSDYAYSYIDLEYPPVVCSQH